MGRHPEPPKDARQETEAVTEGRQGEMAAWNEGLNMDREKQVVEAGSTSVSYAASNEKEGPALFLVDPSNTTKDISVPSVSPVTTPTAAVSASPQQSAAAEIVSAFPTSPTNALNWPASRKRNIALTLALTGFVSTAGTSIGVPGLYEVMQTFGVQDRRVGVLITGANVLGLGMGPFIFAPISELYGRQPAYMSAGLLYTIFFLATAFAKSMPSLIVLRFICGVFGSVPPSLGVATCADMYAPEKRGKPISLYALGPIAGPILGSMIGYWLLPFGWRWAYWFMTILSALSYTLMIMFMRETYAPAIQKIQIYHHTRRPNGGSTSPAIQASSSHRSLLRYLPDLSWMPAMVSRSEAKTVYKRTFSRPPRLLFLNPVAFSFSVYYSFIYAIIYLFLVTLPLLYGRPPFSQPSLFSYQWPLATLPLAYIPLGLGFLTGGTIAANTQDRIYRYLSHRNGDKGQPEYRLVLTQIGMCFMPIGLLIFGWTAHAETHWIGPFVGQYFVGLGLVLAFNTIQNFFVDAFSPYAAAAVAGATATRSIIACILPLFAGDMFLRLHWGWGGTLLALVAMLGVPCPLIMFWCGKRLRNRFAFHG